MFDKIEVDALCGIGDGQPYIASIHGRNDENSTNWPNDSYYRAFNRNINFDNNNVNSSSIEMPTMRVVMNDLQQQQPQIDDHRDIKKRSLSISDTDTVVASDHHEIEMPTDITVIPHKLIKHPSSDSLSMNQAIEHIKYDLDVTADAQLRKGKKVQAACLSCLGSCLALVKNTIIIIVICSSTFAGVLELYKNRNIIFPSLNDNDYIRSTRALDSTTLPLMPITEMVTTEYVNDDRDWPMFPTIEPERVSEYTFTTTTTTTETIPTTLSTTTENLESSSYKTTTTTTASTNNNTMTTMTANDPTTNTTDTLSSNENLTESITDASTTTTTTTNAKRASTDTQTTTSTDTQTTTSTDTQTTTSTDTQTTTSNTTVKPTTSESPTTEPTTSTSTESITTTKNTSTSTESTPTAITDDDSTVKSSTNTTTSSIETKKPTTNAENSKKDTTTETSVSNDDSSSSSTSSSTKTESTSNV
ncbi:hypothetical protein HT594_00073 [Phenacoccus solenopsis nudivirus]|nr:hypothetical protein HT594_00073 [Phenacoccus solenopsis nudivirus]